MVPGGSLFDLGRDIRPGLPLYPENVRRKSNRDIEFMCLLLEVYRFGKYVPDFVMLHHCYAQLDPTTDIFSLVSLHSLLLPVSICTNIHDVI